MIHFIDGPARDAALSLRRTPLFLRVVIDQDGTVDALDQLDDKPEKTEKIYVYRLVEGSVSHAIACRRGEGCTPIPGAEYKIHTEQPQDEEIRSTEAWRKWTEAQRQ